MIETRVYAGTVHGDNTRGSNTRRKTEEWDMGDETTAQKKKRRQRNKGPQRERNRHN